MVRRGRVEYPGAIYHIIQRGNNREDVFDSLEKKDYFISLLSKSVAMDGAELYAYVVMNNHYHLALKTCRETLSKVMHRLNSRYGIYYNRQMKRTGHVFQGRYKAIPVLDESFLMVLVKYIHQNPVRAVLRLTELSLVRRLLLPDNGTWHCGDWISTGHVIYGQTKVLRKI